MGIVEKNPPFAIPFTTTTTIRGPINVETGQMIIILRPLSKTDMNSVLTGPRRSQQSPHSKLPSAEEKLSAATILAPAFADSPIELAYRGRKNGGTRRGKVAIAPVAKRRRN